MKEYQITPGFDIGMSERACALRIASGVINDCEIKPNEDIFILARQLIRAHQALALCKDKCRENI